MSWDSFAYLCRRAAHELGDGESLSACFQRLSQAPSASLYGRPPLANALTNDLLVRLAAEPERGRALTALKAYAGMGQLSLVDRAMQFKRVLIYLGFVAVIFFFMSAIYQIKVLPAFIETFKAFDVPLPASVFFLHEYWHVFSLSVLLLLLLALVIGLSLRRLLRLPVVADRKLPLGFLLLPGIKRAYLSLQDILTFPLRPSLDSSSFIDTHLADIQRSGLDLGREMQIMSGIALQELVQQCERQMRVISVAIALLVVANVLFFINSAYSPIIMLGEVV